MCAEQIMKVVHSERKKKKQKNFIYFHTLHSSSLRSIFVNILPLQDKPE